MSILATQTVTENATLEDATGMLFVDAATGSFTVNLPATSASDGRLVNISRYDLSYQYAVTIAANKSDTIGSENTFSLYSGGNLQIVADNTRSKWEIIFNTPGLYLSEESDIKSLRLKEKVRQ